MLIDGTSEAISEAKSQEAMDTRRRFVEYAFVTEAGVHVRFRRGVEHNCVGILALWPSIL